MSADDRSLHIDAGLTVSFDTYFNSFYASYWSECTSVSTVTLRLQLAGRGVVTVVSPVARRPGGAGRSSPVRQCHGDDRRDPAARIRTVPPARRGGCGSTSQADTDCTLYGGEWVTPDPPVRRVSPSVVICTFNRVEYLSRIMRALADRKDVYEEISRIFIVNQGDRFDLSDLVTDANEDFLGRIELIEQENLGGCGGFTRGMYETLRDDSLTHFILLDDDVRLHPESLFRAIRFMGTRTTTSCSVATCSIWFVPMSCTRRAPTSTPRRCSRSRSVRASS